MRAQQPDDPCPPALWLPLTLRIASFNLNNLFSRYDSIAEVASKEWMSAARPYRAALIH